MNLKRLCMMFGLIICLAGCSQPTFYDVEGKPIHLSDYHGKWVVINYWASWCLPCSLEIPELNAFYFAHKDKDAVVFGFNNDQLPLSQIPARAQQMGVMFPTLATDPSDMLGVVSIPGLPLSFLIGPDGKLKRTLMGEQTKKTLEVAMGLPS